MTLSPVQRDIVLISFPFSALDQSKVRPVIVVSSDSYNKKFKDFIAIPLTSTMYPMPREYSTVITNDELESGQLPKTSIAKIDRIQSLEKTLIVKKIAVIKKDVYGRIRDMLFNELINQD